eukprot:COSAG01_NODE_18390_length_1079_cov_0.943878_1_plen_49_part_10
MCIAQRVSGIPNKSFLTLLDCLGDMLPKATFPFVTARQWVDGWRLFFLN